ncbi:MAG: hypothetical protein FD161_617 [Limisphaerales bacterium]|nr:MAG: hypothetical protein FD161_617 [Limisphaerales bacterium]KAG0510222.1 MAG: hypothetical protein E1N63_617 [Limisphaerales bacterium]TXT51895.1 MAG: hypothetical protein FD140_1283 [Limisphaerales bacterium]
MNTTNTCNFITPLFTRRDILRTFSCGFGYLAFAGLAARAAGTDKPLAPKQPHFTPRAKRVIFLCMTGGPSHVDTFDYKPQLIADGGKPSSRPGATWLAPRSEFKQRGKSGLWISDYFPNLAQHADELCLVRSMHTDLPAHPQAFLRMHTGSSQFVRPSLGAWTTYGLGSENENLPGFITITPPNGFGGAQNYGSSFLPAIYQGTRVGVQNRPIAQAEVKNLRPPLTAQSQRLELDLIQSLNREALARDPQNAQIEGVIESYELAFKMQGEMPAVMDLGKETEATKKLYGIEDRGTRGGGGGGGAFGGGGAGTDDFGRKCLLARRFLEAGVRFVEICHGNWDQHFNLGTALRNNCTSIDLPIAGLLTDLKQRGLLKDTLVVWSGEFGRTPYAQGNDGRDHNNKGFTLWMAGGGAKGGSSYGSTDEHGGEAVSDKVHIHDLHATILHLLGLNHEKLTFRYAGRDFRLTDVKGEVVKGVVA